MPASRQYVQTSAALLCVLFTFSGCQPYFRNLKSAERLNRGYTIVLPGIDGASQVNSNIAQGLQNGGVETAIEVFDWTTGRSRNYQVHLKDLARNRRQAQLLAQRIVDYQDQYPGRPVHLVGHSGGGGVILLSLEALPDDRNVNSAILLGPAVSPTYDLSRALAKTQAGIWNFYSPLDIPFLVIGTSLEGTIDRHYTAAAGATGFKYRWDLDDQAAGLDRTKLHQIPYRWTMLGSGNLGGHFGWTSIWFSRDYLAPILRQNSTEASTVNDNG